MSLKIALILSVVIQFITAGIALSLIKRTRTNIAWWLISIGFLLMAVRRLFELPTFFKTSSSLNLDLVNTWTGIIISIIMLVSLSFIKRIFNIQKRIEDLKRKKEADVFSAIIKAEEEQKKKFSKELHDGLGPLLSSVKMTLSAISKKPHADNVPELLKRTELSIDESISSIKEIANSMNPHVLNNFGIEKAIKSFINKLPDKIAANIHFESNINNKRFNPNIEITIYRVVCELINNSLKHANAQNVFITIEENKSIININYLDDGVGFYLEDEDLNNTGFGLKNIRSRIKSVHGNCEIKTKPGAGFNMIITIQF